MDWLVLCISVVFVVTGLFILPSNRDAGIVTVAFFGTCGAVAAATIARKLRFSRMRPLHAEIAGGIPIRPSRASLFTVGAGFAGLGGILIVFGRSYGTIFWSMSWLTALVGAFLLVALALRWLPVGYIQFDPDGITIGEHRWAFTVPWDRVARIASGEFHDNPVLYIWIDQLESVIVQPPELRPKVIKRLATNARWVGAHVMLMTTQYQLDIPPLMRALERYIAHPASRAELAPRKLLPAAT